MFLHRCLCWEEENQPNNKNVRILSLGLCCTDSLCSHHSGGSLAFPMLKALVGIGPATLQVRGRSVPGPVAGSAS